MKKDKRKRETLNLPVHHEEMHDWTSNGPWVIDGATYEKMFPNREIQLVDPDGWDRLKFNYSWNEELISLGVFSDRILNSTIKGDLNILKSMQII